MAQAEAALLEDEEIVEDLDQDEDQQDDQNTEPEDDEEIVLDGDDGSHPKDEQYGIRKRINKLNAKVAEATDGQKQSTAELEVERERNRLLQLALDQQGTPVDGPPDPNDFDNGVADAEYVKAFQNHIAKGVKAEVLKTQHTVQEQTQITGQLQESQVAHYKKADKLKVRDYDATEDAAIAILGQDVTNQIISKTDKSPQLLYYLGKNPDAAEDLSALIKSDPVKGVLKIGRLEARLIARPRAKPNNAPDPDEELTGGGSGKPRGERGPKGATFE